MPTKREEEYSAKYIQHMEKLMDDIKRAESIITRAEGILALLNDEFETILSRSDIKTSPVIILEDGGRK
jgi:hypothetical protein